MVETAWELPSEFPELDDGQVNIFHFHLDYPQEDVFHLLECLSEPERNRADRFKRPIHRERFATGRAFLRHILAFYTGQRASEISFAYGAQGKPSLSALACGSEFRFNLSHSHDQAVCAITSEREVGVDIEAHRDRISVQAIADRFFAAEESAHVQSLPAEERMVAFYQYWTAKEALLKGEGGGLTLPLNCCRFEIDTIPMGLTLTGLKEIEGASWCVYPFSPAVGYSGALAVAGGETEIRYFRWGIASHPKVQIRKNI